MNPKDVTIINASGMVSAGIEHSDDPTENTYYTFQVIGFGSTEEEARSALKKAVAEIHSKITECLP